MIRHASRDDVDVQLARERGKTSADGLCVLIARRGKVARGHEARVPRLGQDDNVGAVFPDSAAHERLRAVKVRFALQRAHIHLDHADLHGGVLQNRFDTVIIRKESLHCNAQQKEDGKCRPLVCKSVADFAVRKISVADFAAAHGANKLKSFFGTTCACQKTLCTERTCAPLARALSAVKFCSKN